MTTENKMKPIANITMSGIVLALLSVIGCGGGDKSAPADSDQAKVPPSTSAAAVTASDVSPPPETSSGVRRQNERWADENGVEYLGNVPLDVFFDRPLDVARDATPLQNGAALAGMPSEVPAVSPAVEATQEDPDSAGADGPSWDSLITAEALKNEVTDARNFLNRSLQRYGDYKKATLMIPGKAASIAVLASVAMEHPEKVSWKEDAIYIRDLAKRINEDTLRPDKKDHERVLILFENIASTLDRSRPADLEEPNPDDTFSDVASMDMVMVRLDEAEKRLRTEAASESAFESKKDLIQHEASMLATLSHVIALESYGYADDEEFVGYAQQIVTAAEKIKNATEANDFNTYELALSKVSTSCSDCHSAYRNN